MPLRGPGAAAPVNDAPDASIEQPIRRTGLRGPSASVSAPSGSSDEGSSWGLPTVAGAAALGGAALLARSPNAPSIVRKGLEYANAARQQLMLSGFAPIKSLLGNVGAAVAESAETKSLSPLREFLSMDTVRDAVSAYKNGSNAVHGGVNIPGPMPGRIMGAIDEATQKALVRSGMTPEGAESAVFQSPLGKNWGPAGEHFNSPVADYLFPFRRTPLNQFAEGLKTLKGDHPVVLAGYTGVGALHGAMTKDDKFPLSVPLAISASAKYGLPYGLGAIAGRYLAGGKGAGNTAGSVLPVSEYGLTQSIEEPLAPFQEPAALRALKQLTGR